MKKEDILKICKSIGCSALYKHCPGDPKCSLFKKNKGNPVSK